MSHALKRLGITLKQLEKVTASLVAVKLSTGLVGLQFTDKTGQPLALYMLAKSRG